MKSGRTENRLTAYFNNGIESGSTTPPSVTRTDTLTGAAPVFMTATNYYGNTGRNILNGPFERDADIGLTKITPIQAFTLTNTPNFASPASDIGTSSTFGVITATVGNPRILQFALKLTY
jgi:hypothetical protein